MVKVVAKKTLVVAKKTREPESSSHRKGRKLARRFDKLKITDKNKKAILYLGHIPKGMNEEQLKEFLT